MAQRRLAVVKDIDPEANDIAAPEERRREDDPAARQLLEAGSYRDYLRHRIQERFPALVTAFLDAAASGSAVHMRMIVALLESAEEGLAGEAGAGSAERAEEAWEELHRKGAKPNLYG